MEQWVTETHARIASAIKRLRDEAGMSAQQLADRTAKLGYAISRSQIANYESARKKNLDITELVVLAAALNTSPVSLIYPGPYRRSVSVLPGKVVTEFEAVQWFSALDWLNMLIDFDVSQDLDELVARGVGDDAPAIAGAFRVAALEARNQWRDGTKEIGLWRLRDELQSRLNELMRKRDFATDHVQIGTYTKMIQELSAQLQDQ